MNQTLEEAMTIQQIGLNSHHTDLITTILSCIPQVCRGIPTRAHWIYSSPGTGLPVLAYIKMIPIFHEASGTTQFLMTLAEISLPSHILADPLRMLSHPVVTPKISTPQQHPEDSLSDIFFDFAPLEIPQLNSTFVKKNHLDFFH